MGDLDLTLSLIVDKLDKIMAMLGGNKLETGRVEAARAEMKEARKAIATPGNIEPLCKFCGGTMYDNTVNKKNPKAPDYKCKDKACNYVAWLKTNGEYSWRKSTF